MFEIHSVEQVSHGCVVVSGTLNGIAFEAHVTTEGEPPAGSYLNEWLAYENDDEPELVDDLRNTLRALGAAGRFVLRCVCCGAIASTSDDEGEAVCADCGSDAYDGGELSCSCRTDGWSRCHNCGDALVWHEGDALDCQCECGHWSRQLVGGDYRYAYHRA